MRRGRRKLWARIGLGLFALLVAAQLVPVERGNPPVKVEIPAPGEVRAVLGRSCYDCHSNRTRWPWYARLAPASWWIARHVREGRADLNLTEWPLLDFEAQQFLLGEMRKQLEEREMPLDSYLLLHWDAWLSDAERSLLVGWIDEEIDALSGF